MPNLIQLTDFSDEQIVRLWRNVQSQTVQSTLPTRVAWSFEGNGIRTRTSFIQAFQALGQSYVELPNLLKTAEAVSDLAGYLDDYYDLYVIRDTNHQRLYEFANASRRPVINAMSNVSHPCEVLADAFYLQQTFGDIREIDILLWGPLTNVLLTWYELAEVFDFKITHFCPPNYREDNAQVTYIDYPEGDYDVVITDGWPVGFSDSTYTLTNQHFSQLGNAIYLPVPPVTKGKELSFNLKNNERFVGYEQKGLLLSVQIEVIKFLLTSDE